jgi:hypothetical protein
MFSDRGWACKVAGALLAFASLCHHSARSLSDLLVDDEFVATKPHLVRGKLTHLWAKTVTAADPGGVTLACALGPVRVEGVRAATGDVVTVVGVVEGPRLVRALRFQQNEGYRWKRPLNYAISLLTLGVVLAAAARRLRLRLRDGLLEARD